MPVIYCEYAHFIVKIAISAVLIGSLCNHLDCKTVLYFIKSELLVLLRMLNSKFIIGICSKIKGGWSQIDSFHSMKD